MVKQSPQRWKHNVYVESRGFWFWRKYRFACDTCKVKGKNWHLTPDIPIEVGKFHNDLNHHNFMAGNQIRIGGIHGGSPADA